ncbi:MAG: matrixin family metalloprotease [Proteobacteria bacterium]|nr:MAG: matrixin family metalloprotease [Pseudomonadota bacterium]
MTSKSSILILLLFAFILPSESLFAFVHISAVKPHLPVSPEHPNIIFQWNGDAPSLSKKSEVFDGAYAESSDNELMEALLQEAVNKWNNVESAYLNFEVVVNPGVVKSDEDEIYAIVVESQDSFSVAAAALPVFAAKGDSPSGNKKSGRIIYDCDISVSSSGVDAQELLRTLVHEIGHCVGLGHPHSNYHSIMSYSNMSSSAELGLDDKAGISFLYPEPGVSQDVKYLTTCGTLAGLGGQGYWILLLPLGLLGFRRKKASQQS